MERVLPRSLVGVAATAWVVVNGALVALLAPNAVGGDWRIFWFGSLGADISEYLFPPLTTWLWLTVVIPLGFQLSLLVNALLHLVALVPLRREPWVLVAVAVSAGFWHDTLLGNVSLYGIVLGWMALRGSTGAWYWIWFVLFPKPAFLPLAVWLAWKQPRLLIIPLVVGALTLLTGQADEWISRSISTAGEYPYRAWDFGPTRLLGSTWLLVGLPLAAWLTWKGHVGWAGMAITPYLIPTYWLLAIWELQEPLHERRVAGVALRRADDRPLPVLVGRLRRS